MNSIYESIVLRLDAADCLEDKVSVLALALKEMPDIGINIPAEVPLSFLPELQVIALMDSIQDGQPFTVEFEKKDGNLRRMLCSLNSEKSTGDKGAGVHLVFDREAGRVKAFRSSFVTSITVG